MAKTQSSYPDKKTKELFKAILALKNMEEARRFFRDLLTLSEIEEFANRFQMAKLLYQGNSYLKVAEKLKTSTTTVTRVAHWLFRGMNGYKLILSRLFQKKNKEYLKELAVAKTEIKAGKGKEAKKVFEKLGI